MDLQKSYCMLCYPEIVFSKTKCQPESELSGVVWSDGEDGTDEPGEDSCEDAGGGGGRQPHAGLAKATASKNARTRLELILKPTAFIVTSYHENDSCIQKLDWLIFSTIPLHLGSKLIDIQFTCSSIENMMNVEWVWMTMHFQGHTSDISAFQKLSANLSLSYLNELFPWLGFLKGCLVWKNCIFEEGRLCSLTGKWCTDIRNGYCWHMCWQHHNWLSHH